MSFLTALGEYLYGQPAFSEEELNLMRQGFSNALLGQVTPTITAQVPGIENITLGQAPIVSQGGIQYQPSYNRPIMSAGTVERSDLNVRPDGTYTLQATPFQVLGAGFADALDAIQTDKMSIDDYRAKQAEDQIQTYEQAQGLPLVQLEALERLSSQPEATLTLPSGEIGSPQYNFYNRMQSGQPLSQQEIAQAQAFAQTMGTTFDPKTGYAKPTRAALQDVLAPRGLTTVGGAPLSEFLSGAAMPEYGFTRSERQMAGRGTTPTQSQFDKLSAEREARMEADILNSRGAYVRDPNTGKKVAAGSKDHAIIIEAERAAERAGMTGSSKKNAFMALYKEQRQEEEELTKDLNDLKLQYETYRTQGQALNMERTRAQIEKYQKSEAEKYQEIYSIAEKLFNDGLLDEEQAVLFIIDRMGGDIDDMYIDAESLSVFGGGATPNIPQAAIDALRADPSRADEFDAYYGVGSSAKLLK